MIRILICAALAACSDSDSKAAARPMTIHHEFDFLLAAGSTSELYDQHVGDDAETIARVRAALAGDSRDEVRRNAVVALTAALGEKGIPDFIGVLDDRSPSVSSEAAYSLVAVAPEHPAAMDALRAHAASLRAALLASDPTARFNAAQALEAIADPEIDLAVMLRDESALVRSEGLRLAAKRELADAQVTLLDQLARTDPDDKLRIQAATVVAFKAPEALAVPVVAAAIARGDVDLSTANAVEQHHLIGVVPAILAYLQRRPAQTYWLATLMTFKPMCAARAIAGLLDDPTSGFEALMALRTLSGRAGANATELAAWAKTQPDDVGPCAAK